MPGPERVKFFRTRSFQVFSFFSKGAYREHDDDTPLHLAAANGHAAVATLLIDNKADINAKNNSGYTPLHLAALNGKEAVATLLIAKGAQVNAKDKYGYTPLHWAAFHGRKEVAALLIANGAQVNARDNDGKTPLGESEYNSWWYNAKAVATLLRERGGVE